MMPDNLVIKRLLKKGFTMIEVVTVSGIMALFALTTISLLLSTIRGGTKSQLVQHFRQDGEFALNTMVRMVRNSIEANCYADFTITNPDGLTTTFSLIEYDLGDGDSINRIASNSSDFLTGVRADVSDLNFSCYQTDLGNQVVTIAFTLSAGQESGAQSQEKLTQTFATSTSTRQY